MKTRAEIERLRDLYQRKADSAVAGDHDTIAMCGVAVIMLSWVLGEARFLDDILQQADDVKKEQQR